MKLEKLNPSVKVITGLIAVILLSFQYLISLNLIVFGLSVFLLLFFSDAKPGRIAAILVPAFFAAFGLFLMGAYYARGNSVSAEDLANLSTAPYAVRAAMSQNLHTAVQLATRLLAYAGFGVLFALSTDGEDFVSSLMHQLRLPPKFAYGVLAAVHLMPNMVTEFGNVRLAYRTRGIKTNAFSIGPLFTMLVNSIRWSESVAMAMESKGFCGEADRTYYNVPHVHWYDFLWALFCIGGIVLGMIFLKY